MKNPHDHPNDPIGVASARELERRLGYCFTDPKLLIESLCHRSYVNEQARGQKIRDNERLEFLGDAVLNLVISDLLMQRFARMREGDLSRIRSRLVNERQLAGVATRIALGEHILLGKGEAQTQGKHKQSILADTFEALLAAVYLDGGFDAVFAVVQRHFSDLLDSYADVDTAIDHKSKLQEKSQLARQSVPVYQVTAESGPDHNKTFEVTVCVHDITGRGVGKSKKAAEQNAARNALSKWPD